MNVDRLSQMLELQEKLQAEAYGVYPYAITKSGDMSYIKDMVLAATDELHEMLGETSWKPWTSGAPYVNTDSFKKELVDLFHFVMNLMLSVDMSADELYEMYMKKRQVNINRQAMGYDGVSTKCVKCHRALEDVVLHQIHIETGILIRCACGQNIPFDVAQPFLTN